MTDLDPDKLAKHDAAVRRAVLTGDGPNLGFPTNEPSLRAILIQYYTRWDVPEPERMADAYLAALIDKEPTE